MVWCGCEDQMWTAELCEGQAGFYVPITVPSLFARLRILYDPLFESGDNVIYSYKSTKALFIHLPATLYSLIDSFAK
jgi:hypothetical protein